MEILSINYSYSLPATVSTTPSASQCICTPQKRLEYDKKSPPLSYNHSRADSACSALDELGKGFHWPENENMPLDVSDTPRLICLSADMFTHDDPDWQPYVNPTIIDQYKTVRDRTADCRCLLQGKYKLYILDTDPDDPEEPGYNRVNTHYRYRKTVGPSFDDFERYFPEKRGQTTENIQRWVDALDEKWWKDGERSHYDKEMLSGKHRNPGAPITVAAFKSLPAMQEVFLGLARKGHSRHTSEGKTIWVPKSGKRYVDVEERDF